MKLKELLENQKGKYIELYNATETIYLQNVDDLETLKKYYPSEIFTQLENKDLTEREKGKRYEIIINETVGDETMASLFTVEIKEREGK